MEDWKMNFERGKDPKESMGIGRDAILKEIGGIIFDRPHYEIWKMGDFRQHKENVVILLEDGRYEIVKNNFSNYRPKGPESELITVLLKLRDEFRKWDNPDLVTVKPMSAPTGRIFYTDYQYKVEKKKIVKI